MDKVSRDVLDETKSVLCELIGYLSVVEENHGVARHPALSVLSERLGEVVSEIEGYDGGASVLRTFDGDAVERWNLDASR